MEWGTSVRLSGPRPGRFCWVLKTCIRCPFPVLFHGFSDCRFYCDGFVERSPSINFISCGRCGCACVRQWCFSGRCFVVVAVLAVMIDGVNEVVVIVRVGGSFSTNHSIPYIDLVHPTNPSPRSFHSIHHMDPSVESSDPIHLVIPLIRRINPLIIHHSNQNHCDPSIDRLNQPSIHPIDRLIHPIDRSFNPSYN